MTHRLRSGPTQPKVTGEHDSGEVLNDTSCALGSNTSKLLLNLRGPVQYENAEPPFQKMENFNTVMAESRPQAAPLSAAPGAGRSQLAPRRPPASPPRAPGANRGERPSPPHPTGSRRERNPEKGLRGGTQPQTSAAVVCDQGTPFLLVGWNYN